MIGFIKLSIWISQLAQTHESYDNRAIKEHKYSVKGLLTLGTVRWLPNFYMSKARLINR